MLLAKTIIEILLFEVVLVSFKAKMDLITPLNEAKMFIINCFKAVGTSEEHAEIAAKNLLEADYRGHYSHGMNRLNFYIHALTKKLLDPNAKPQIEKETVATALVNGNNGLGFVIGKYCMDLAIKKAKDVGIGMVAVHESNHYGIAGMYALQAIEQGCIGISVSNTSPLMVPTRAQAAALGTNPISVGAPCLNDDSLLLDMATTNVAVGKLEIYRRKGEALPKGWALNKKGEMETDPLAGIKASRLLPLGGEELTGGYKGYGLGIMVEVLSGVLSGANSGPQIPSMTADHCERQANLGQSFIAINPQVFAAGFEDRLSNLMNYLRHMEPRDPDKPVLVPGDPERLHMEKVNCQGGLCYVADQHHSNNLLSEKLKVPPMKSVEITKV